MPTITINRKEFEKIVGKKLPEAELKDRISMLGTDLESVNNEEIIVEIFPNRPDMLSVQGFARAFATFVGAKKGLSKFGVQKSGEKVIIEKGMEKIRPYTACAIIKGMKFDDQKIKDVIQIQEKLHVTFGRNRKKIAIGIYPFEKIKTPIRFIAADPDKLKFRPLEYDSEITCRKILSKTSTGREYSHLLEGYKKFPVFIDAKDNVLSMPPIINSHDTGKIDYKTTDVFIECSGFDFDVLQSALNIIVTAFADMGGKIYSVDLIYPDKKRVTPDLNPKKMKLDVDYINKHLGLELKRKEMQNLLLKMGYGSEGNDILVPAYRADIMHQVDFAEDVAIAYGIENFVEEIPNVATVGEEGKRSKIKNIVANILVGLGFIELNTYNLINKNSQTKMMNVDVAFVEVANSLSKEYDSLRNWILPSVMEVFKGNRNREYPQKIFDVGTIFAFDDKQETGVREDFHVSAGICHEKANYTEIRQAFDYLMRMLNLNYEIVECEHDSFIEGRIGKIFVNGNAAGMIGEINPQVLSNFELIYPISAFELDLSSIFGM